MPLSLRWWLLLSVLFIIQHCEVRSADAEPSEDAPEDQEEEEPPEGDEGETDMYADEEGADEEGEDDGGEPAEDEENEPMEPLTSEQMHALHKKMDTNGNGKVSLAEVTDFAHTMRRAMAKMELDDVMKSKDTNKDGKLDFQEFLGDPGRVPEQEQNEKANEFKELDANSDKFVDPDELANLFHHHTNDKVETSLTNIAMKDKDKNKDGVLSLEEFYLHLQPEEEDPVEISQEDRDIFNKLDMDNSGTLTLKELKAWESGSFMAEEAVKKLFVHADKDNDNVVTAAELDSARHDIASDPDYDAQMYLQQWNDHHEGHGEL